MLPDSKLKGANGFTHVETSKLAFEQIDHSWGGAISVMPGHKHLSIRPSERAGIENVWANIAGVTTECADALTMFDSCTFSKMSSYKFILE